MEYQVLDNAPNLVGGCIIQRESSLTLVFYSFVEHSSAQEFFVFNISTIWDLRPKNCEHSQIIFLFSGADWTKNSK